MQKLIAWFARNRVAANLLMLVIVAGGFASISRLVMEVFPELEIQTVIVSVSYPGSTPEEVEETICVPIEEAVHDLDGVERITSKAVENKGTVTIEAEADKDLGELLDEVKSRVDAITTFPEDAEKPYSFRIIYKRSVMNLTLSGDADELTLKLLGEKMRDELAALPDITLVELNGVRDYEVAVEVSEETLRRHGLSINDVSQAINRYSQDLSGGTVKSRGGEILLRTKGKAYVARDFEKIPIISKSDGSTLFLRDIAKVKDGFAEEDRFYHFDGKPAVRIEVFRVGKQNVLEVADAVNEYLEKARPNLPEGIKVDVWRDRSLYFKDRLDLMLRNGGSGLILVVVLLGLFLRARVAMWVSLGIPISFLGAIWVMPALGASLNMITMFAFILVLGIVVDDAIVVGENIHTQQTLTGRPLDSAVKGATEVAIPVIFAVLTTVAAFYPLIGLPGVNGQIWGMLPLIVIPCLLFSLVESLLVLPAHLSHVRNKKEKETGPWVTVNRVVGKGLNWFVQSIYRPVLEKCLAWRYLTVSIFVLMLAVSVAMVLGGRLKTTFFPHIESDWVNCTLEMKPGTPFEDTSRAVERIEAAGRELDKLYSSKLPKGVNLVEHIYARAVNNEGDIRITLMASQERSKYGISASEVATAWYKLIGPIPQAAELSMRSSLGRRHNAITVELAGRDMAQLSAAANRFKEMVLAYPGTYEVTDSFREGKREIRLKLKPAAATLGISVADLARQVRRSFYGAEAQRIIRGREEVKIMVRYPEDTRRSLGTLEDMRIRTPDGAEIPIQAVAELIPSRGLAVINRADRQRVVTISAKVDKKIANAEEVVNALNKDDLPALASEFPGVNAHWEGQVKEQGETTDELMRKFGLALFMIYALMAIPFKSYLQPAIVMTAIPFSAVGVIWGHLSLGMDLSAMSAMGFVALAGVVVNDSLVLVDYINRRLAEGEGLHKTVRIAGEARFRPILLTSLTTFAGLMPLLLEESLQAKFLVPMAVSLGYGVMFSTFITLILVPASYIILEDFKKILDRTMAWWRG